MLLPQGTAEGPEQVRWSFHISPLNTIQDQCTAMPQHPLWGRMVLCRVLPGITVPHMVRPVWGVSPINWRMVPTPATEIHCVLYAFQLSFP